jgi:hypothetical protein
MFQQEFTITDIQRSKTDAGVFASATFSPVLPAPPTVQNYPAGLPGGYATPCSFRQSGIVAADVADWNVDDRIVVTVAKVTA